MDSSNRISIKNFSKIKLYYMIVVMELFYREVREMDCYYYLFSVSCMFGIFWKLFYLIF